MKPLSHKLNYIIESYPALNSADPLRRFASPVPLEPATTFDIYHTESGYMSLITTDYPDPIHQRAELLEITKGQDFYMTDIIPPKADPSDGNTIQIDTIDEEAREWLIYVKKSAENNLPYNTYYCLVNVTRG